MKLLKKLLKILFIIAAIGLALIVAVYLFYAARAVLLMCIQDYNHRASYKTIKTEISPNSSVVYNLKTDKYSYDLTLDRVDKFICSEKTISTIYPSSKEGCHPRIETSWKPDGTLLVEYDDAAIFGFQSGISETNICGSTTRLEAKPINPSKADYCDSY